jgi:hypothetical protein
VFLYRCSLLQSKDHRFQELMIEVRGSEVSVAMRGTCLKAAFRKGDAPWLVCSELGPEDPDALVTLSEFRALAVAPD